MSLSLRFIMRQTSLTWMALPLSARFRFIALWKRGASLGASRNRSHLEPAMSIAACIR